MQTRLLKVGGWLLIGLGILFTVSPNLTGLAISDGISGFYSSFFGIFLFVSGIILITLTQNLESKARDEFVEKHYKYFRQYLEKGEFKNLQPNAYEQYSQMRARMLKSPYGERDREARHMLYHLAKLEDKPNIEKPKPVIIRTKEFEKAIKGYDARQIQDAIDKIDTGKGEQEPLHYGLKGMFSIRAGKKERIIFSRTGNKIILEEYRPDHKYTKGE